MSHMRNTPVLLIGNICSFVCEDQIKSATYNEPHDNYRCFIDRLLIIINAIQE